MIENTRSHSLFPHLRLCSPSLPITSHHIPLHPITSHCIPSHHIPSHHIPSHHIPSHHIPSRPITSHHITFHHITSRHVTSRHVTSRHVTSHPIPSHPMPSLSPALYDASDSERRQVFSRDGECPSSLSNISPNFFLYYWRIFCFFSTFGLLLFCIYLYIIIYLLIFLAIVCLFFSCTLEFLSVFSGLQMYLFFLHLHTV